VPDSLLEVVSKSDMKRLELGHEPHRSSNL
jgi:hypothetical protein